MIFLRSTYTVYMTYIINFQLFVRICIHCFCSYVKRISSYRCFNIMIDNNFKGKKNVLEIFSINSHSFFYVQNVNFGFFLSVVNFLVLFKKKKKKENKFPTLCDT